MTELKTAIEKSHNSTDEVHYNFLKQISQKSKELLLKIYNDIWTGKQFPKSWKQATIIPIPKSEKKYFIPWILSTNSTNWLPMQNLRKDG